MENLFGPLVQVADDLFNNATVAAKRADGRDWQEMRPLFLRTGVLSQAAGSAYFESAGTKLFVAVYGPRPVGATAVGGGAPDQGAEVHVEVKFASFVKASSGSSAVGDTERDLAQKTTRAIRSAVRRELYPKTQLEVFAFVLQNDGGVGSAIATAASLALADAGVECKELFAGCQVSHHAGPEPRLAVDPTLKESEDSSATISFTMLVTSETLVGVDATATAGNTPSEISEAATLARGGVQQIAKHMRTALARSVSKGVR